MTTIRVECPECKGNCYGHRDPAHKRRPCDTCDGSGWLPGKVGVVPREGTEREREGVRS